MSKAPYRIIYHSDEQFSSWEFDEEEFETPETAYNEALKRYQYNPFRIIKLCYPKED